MTHKYTQIARFIGPTWGHLGPVGPRWAPCWPDEPCYEGFYDTNAVIGVHITNVITIGSNYDEFRWIYQATLLYITIDVWDLEWLSLMYTL